MGEGEGSGRGRYGDARPSQMRRRKEDVPDWAVAEAALRAEDAHQLFRQPWLDVRACLLFRTVDQAVNQAVNSEDAARAAQDVSRRTSCLVQRSEDPVFF